MPSRDIFSCWVQTTVAANLRPKLLLWGRASGGLEVPGLPACHVKRVKVQLVCLQETFFHGSEAEMHLLAHVRDLGSMRFNDVNPIP